MSNMKLILIYLYSFFTALTAVYVYIGTVESGQPMPRWGRLAWTFSAATTATVIMTAVAIIIGGIYNLLTKPKDEKPMNKVGSRVFAVQKADDDKVCVYGRGVYEGDFEPPGGMHGFTWEELGIAEGERPKNPRIRLDSGEVVWGMQCWWGPEERFDEWMAGREVVIVPVEDLTKGQ